MQLFYHPDLEPGDTFMEFANNESRHISQVLRKKKGDEILITNGRGYFFKAEIEYLNKKDCHCSVKSEEFQQPLPYRLHMAVAPTKLNDRFEWFLEKATEIGINEITPILCEHSERKIIKRERMERILQSAMKQSLSAYLPRLNEMISFKDFVQQQHVASILGIAHCARGERKSLKRIIEPGNDVCILIGPEGDFSQQEIDLARDCGFEEVGLGLSRLRTETAAIVAVNTIALINDH